jgi:hypothetical protein
LTTSKSIVACPFSVAYEAIGRANKHKDTCDHDWHAKFSGARLDDFDWDILN